ncbi:MAG: cytochrome c oxidase subunit II [Verrucomicrobiaceae bacterium]|nr:MAG: cytochrome c oxidase subunit II [Verrucomicrobiaceae bacterium]
MSPSKFLGIPENFSAHGGQVDHMIDVVHWFMIALFVGWTIFFFVCIIRFWHKNNPKASYEGVRSHLSSHLEIGVIIVEAVLLLGFAFPLWADRVDNWKTVQDLNPVRVRVVGWQFGWTYHYSGADGKFGRHDPHLISGTNDLGIDYTDPNAADDFTSPILKLPVNHPAVLNIGTKDVIHNYSIVPMRIQQDAIPGTEIPMWFTPVKTLETFVVCGQLCGEGHGNMVGSMEVVPKDQFDSWFKGQSEGALKANVPKPAATAAPAAEAPAGAPGISDAPAPAGN